ncbi:hypothetical protein CUJ83_02140 [Methanocella sp. CWC-04]|uniref:Dinitrogenase iron-molybdenum cofactor biosynthesis domain-containing protein n=1 Tax=Methanooceanicella nereidis TaxID=2052831 RepID=A0AAP2RBE8_9EURY|nr:NifB/NifX family molybdenum-iron cluster-binding protein [Methanocella sp. CWC-04]MCD1293796.1 hypothetical protein [Methanocella sp. CWC-04]
MKIGIPSDSGEGLNSNVCRGISGCKYFTIVEIDSNGISGVEPLAITLPESVNGMTGAVTFMLSGKGVEAVLVDDIKEIERLSFIGNGIRVFFGANGSISDAVKQYSAGKLCENSEIGKCDCSNR